MGTHLHYCSEDADEASQGSRGRTVEEEARHKDKDQRNTQDSTCWVVAHTCGQGIHRAAGSEVPHYVEADGGPVEDTACMVVPPRDDAQEWFEAEEAAEVDA